MKTQKHPIITRMVNRLIEQQTVTSSGTYDRADPTAFTNGLITFPNSNLEVKLMDGTWGVTIELRLRTNKWRAHKIADCYFDFQDKKLCIWDWRPMHTKLLLRKLKTLN